jgi:serpin B
MMENSGHFLYDAGPEAQVLRLPYGDERVGMLILLPAKGSSPLDLLGRLAATNWGAKLQKIKGHIVLPLLKLDYQADLKRPLNEMGIHRAFTRNADFSGIAANKMFIDEAIQKVSVEVNEEGTIAAAASAIRMNPTAVEIRSFEMVVDRPFLFAICDQQTQTILFLGLVRDPT